jgi:ubiquinone/menaquinone biosynthesis C-methylase UbiE
VLRELAHLCRHAPATLALKSKLPQAELYRTLIERADAAGLAERRAQLVAGLRGKLVEVGCGTGSMFPYYRDAEVTAIEPDPDFAHHARLAAPAHVRVVDASGEALPLADRSMDGAVLALVLCSVPSVDAVLSEVARVVKPGGRVNLLEHVRSERRVAGRLMDLANPLWLRVNGQGCRMNRDPRQALERHGFAIEHEDKFQIWSAGMPAFPMRVFLTRRQ